MMLGYLLARSGVEILVLEKHAFRADISAIALFRQDRVGELKTWDDIKLLTVAVDRLRKKYRPGLPKKDRRRSAGREL